MGLSGLGITEIMFFLLIVLVVFGPKDIVKFSQSAGKFIKNLRKSELWGGVTKMSEEIRNIPDYLVEQADLKDEQETIKSEIEGIKNAFQLGDESIKTNQPGFKVPSKKNEPEEIENLPVENDNDS